MGKQKIKRFRALKPNPTGLVSETGDGDNIQDVMDGAGPGRIHNAATIESFVSSLIEKV